LIVVAVDVGEAAAQLGDLDLAAVDEGVGEEATVAVLGAGYRVGPRGYRCPVRCEALHRSCRSLRPALGWETGADVLRGVDADEADIGEIAAGELDPQGFAVDGVDDLGVDRS
jgi:hypothetical protein